MKKYVLVEVIKWIERTPNAKKKIFIGLGVAAVGFLLVGGLALWAGIAGLKYIAGAAQNVNVASHVQSLQGLGEQAQQVSSAAVGSQCWQKAQGLLSVDAWIQNTPAENIRTFTSACLGAVGSAAPNLVEPAGQDSETESVEKI
jgi:hypothetical protein